MKRLLVVITLLLAITLPALPQPQPEPTHRERVEQIFKAIVESLPKTKNLTVEVVVNQVAPDCSSGCDGPTGEAWSQNQQACLGGINTSCGSGCTCYYGFLLNLVQVGGRTRWVPAWFHISFATGQAVIGEPGPLARHKLSKGDEIWRINGRKPTRESFQRYTQRRPARYARAYRDKQGHLYLRMGR